MNSKVPHTLRCIGTKESVCRMNISPENVGHHPRTGLLGQPALLGARLTVLHALTVKMIDKIDPFTQINGHITLNQKLGCSIAPIVPEVTLSPHGTLVFSRIVELYPLVLGRIILGQKKTKCGPTKVIHRFYPVHLSPSQDAVPIKSKPDRSILRTLRPIVGRQPRNRCSTPTKPAGSFYGRAHYRGVCENALCLRNMGYVMYFRKSMAVAWQGGTVLSWYLAQVIGPLWHATLHPLVDSVSPKCSFLEDSIVAPAPASKVGIGKLNDNRRFEAQHSSGTITAPVGLRSFQHTRLRGRTNFRHLPAILGVMRAPHVRHSDSCLSIASINSSAESGGRLCAIVPNADCTVSREPEGTVLNAGGGAGLEVHPTRSRNGRTVSRVSFRSTPIGLASQSAGLQESDPAHVR